MKKQVFFQMVDTLSMGGTERMSVNMAAVMLEKGWESHLIVSRRGGGMEAHLTPGVHVHYLNKKSFADLAAFWRLARLALRHRPRILHAHSTSVYWAVLLKILIGRFILVWHDHFGLSDQLDQYPRKDMVILSKWIDKIVVVNEKLEKHWKELLPYRSESIQTIGNFAFFNLPSLEKFPVFTFLNLANFRPQKDQLTLVKAADLLAQKGLVFEIVMVGEFVDPVWTEQVKAIIEDSGLSHRMKIIGPTSQVTDFLAKAQAGILSSESEGLPVALLEYGLAGLPVVCTDVGDCARVVSTPQVGYLVPSKDSERLASAMESILKQPERAQEMGKRLKSKVEIEFGKERFLKDYYDLLKLNSN